MALIDVGGDPWLSEHEACERLERDVRAKIVERNREVRGSQAYARASVQVRQKLKEFSTAVQSLKDDLVRASATGAITHGEAERRFHWVEMLQSKERQVVQLASDSSSLSQARSQLLQNQEVDAVVGWGDDQLETEQTRGLPVGDLRQQQQQIFQEQDAGLDALSNVISRQKQMAQTIGNEANYQNEILDDIADHVDSTHSRLLRETQHVSIVDRKDRTWCYWTIIIVLFVTIVVIAVVPV